MNAFTGMGRRPLLAGPIALIIVFTSPSNWAQVSDRGRAGTPKVAAQLARPECLTQTSPAEAQAALDKLGVTVQGATQEEATIIGRTLATLLNRDNNRVIQLIKNKLVIRVNETMATPTGSQAVTPGTAVGGTSQNYEVNVNRSTLFANIGEGANSAANENKALAAATLAHEIGHSVLVDGGEQAKYDAVVETPCRISHYCTHTDGDPHKATHANRQEEAAEAFAAFVFTPDRLKSECPSAYKFMTQLFGNKPVATNGECRAGERLRGDEYEYAWRTINGEYVKLPSDKPAPDGMDIYFRALYELAQAGSKNKVKKSSGKWIKMVYPHRRGQPSGSSPSGSQISR
ncbi:MAG: hypothetical protein AB7G93_05460 [Bdellovibrionales bacterium]